MKITVGTVSLPSHPKQKQQKKENHRGKGKDRHPHNLTHCKYELPIFLKKEGSWENF